MSAFLRRLVDVRDREAPGLIGSFLYFFFLLSSYYVMRPLREEMGVAGGVNRLPWLFTGTFVATLAVVPLWGALVASVPRRRLVPIAYRFFALTMVLFYVLLRLPSMKSLVVPAIFIGISVYNLFVVSVFWSLMADLYSAEQGRRLFGFVAAGGTAGAIAGPFLLSDGARSARGSGELAPRFGRRARDREPMCRSARASRRCAPVAGTESTRRAGDGDGARGRRAATRRRHSGGRFAASPLELPPHAVGTRSPFHGHRDGPLFTVISLEEKYKAKNFIDTVVYRGGDAATAWLQQALTAGGIGTRAMVIGSLPVTGLWLLLVYYLGKRQETLAQQQQGDILRG